MKKLLSLVVLGLTLSLTSCSHFGHCKDGHQCEMKKENCNCKEKNGEQCPMHEEHKADDKKTETKK